MSLYIHESGTLDPSSTTIVFLHGAGTSAWMWDHQIAHFHDFHCLVPDLPGHGKSTTEPWVSLTDVAQQVAELIRTRAHGGRAHLVGLSLGAYVGAHVLAEAPMLVKRVVLSGMTVAPLPGRAIMNAMGRLLVPLLKTEWMARSNAKRLKIPAKQYPAYREGLQSMSGKAFLNASKDASGFQLPAALREAVAPVLALAGQREQRIILEALSVLATTMPHAEARIVPNVGHGWNGEDPELFNQTVRAWLTETALPPTLLPIQAKHAQMVRR